MTGHASGIAIIHAKPGYQALRRGRWSQSGQIYLLTFVARNREALFSDWHAASLAAAILASTDLWNDARLMCWVLMPDHWHGVVELKEGCPLSEVIRIVKGRSAYQINNALGRGGPVWMDGFHDRALRREENLMQVARYVVANPVRAGLVRRAGDYPYWDAVWLP